jgi:hypothetical protein
VEKFMKHLLFGVLCTIACKALFPYPSGDFSEHESVSNSQELNAGYSGSINYSVISSVDTKKYPGFPDFLIWENQETDDEDETVEGFEEVPVNTRFCATRVANSSTLQLRGSAIPLFILFHSWKHFLS